MTVDVDDRCISANSSRHDYTRRKRRTVEKTLASLFGPLDPLCGHHCRHFSRGGGRDGDVNLDGPAWQGRAQCRLVLGSLGM